VICFGDIPLAVCASQWASLYPLVMHKQVPFSHWGICYYKHTRKIRQREAACDAQAAKENIF
jgi:hypothetical protein